MKKAISTQRQEASGQDALATPSELDESAVAKIAEAMNGVLADVFTLYMKTKNFHWHVSGPHFRDYHLLLDEQSDELLEITDPIAERVNGSSWSSRSEEHTSELQSRGQLVCR